MIEQFTAIAQILALLLFMAAAYFGLGRAAFQILRIHNTTPVPAVISIWLGWAFSLLILQIVHLFVSLTAYIVVPLFAVGTVLTIRHVVLVPRRSFIRSDLNFKIALVSIITLLALWTGFRSMLEPTVYDSGLYHFNSIRWINSFPIVPGLGNLHGRLAFNQSFFTYVAALNFHPFFGYGRSLANSFLLLLTVATTLDSVRPLFQRPSLLVESHPFHYATAIFAFPLLGYIAITSEGFSSPTPDVASTILQIAMFVLLAPIISGWMKGEKQKDFQYMVLVIMASTAVTIKLSNAAFSVVIVGICLYYVWRFPGSRIRSVGRILLSCAVVILVWCYRGFILSGAPFYPSTFGYIPVDWAVPVEDIQEMANWIYSWARTPLTHWSNVLGNWGWVGPWRIRISKNIIGIVYPLALSVIFWCIAFTALVISFMKKEGCSQVRNWIILLPPVVSLMFWFFTAPEPRFAEGLFLVLALSSTLLMLSSTQPLLSKKAYTLALCIALLIGSFFITQYLFRKVSFRNILSLSGWHRVRTVELLQMQTTSGLVVFKPIGGDRCWDSPVPCTPYFNANLRLRIPGELGSGFTVRKPQNTGQGNSGMNDSTALYPHQ